MGLERLIGAIEGLPASGQEAELLIALVRAACTHMGYAWAGVSRANGHEVVASHPGPGETAPTFRVSLPGGLELTATGAGDTEGLLALTTVTAKLLDGARTRSRLVQRAERASRKAKEVLERHRSQTLRLSELRGELDATQQNHLVLSERNRIAQDLHDRAAQTNFLLALKLDWLLTDLALDDPLRAELSRLHELAAQAATQTREAIYALRAPELVEGGLQGGLRRLLRALEGDGLTTSMSVSGLAVALPSAVEDALFKIGQEALNNTRKHSRGDAVMVALRYAADVVTLVVQDNGIGLSKGGGNEPPDRYGLRGMRERVSALGGELDLLGGDEGGLIVRATIPLKGAINHVDSHSDRR